MIHSFLHAFVHRHWNLDWYGNFVVRYVMMCGLECSQRINSLLHERKNSRRFKLLMVVGGTMSKVMLVCEAAAPRPDPCAHKFGITSASEMLSRLMGSIVTATFNLEDPTVVPAAAVGARVCADDKLATRRSEGAL